MSKQTVETVEVETKTIEQAPAKVEQFPEEPRRKFEFPRFEWWMKTQYLREDFDRGNANSCLLAKWAEEDLNRKGSVGARAFTYDNKAFTLPAWGTEIVSSFDGGDPLPNCVSRAAKIYAEKGETPFE